MFHGVIPVGDPKVEQIAASIPVKRLGQPADVAHAVRFFCAEDAGFVTGQVLYVCGGTSVGSLTL
jgi:NAD(P)-dependent dehydrogenase (short-subunit alcohol dehydrogenase family)